MALVSLIFANLLSHLLPCRWRSTRQEPSSCRFSSTQRNVELITRLIGRLVQETHELPDGFAYRFDGKHYALLADFITNERRCCPFLFFKLDVAPYQGPTWLHLTAKGDVKPFLREEIGHYIVER